MVILDPRNIDHIVRLYYWLLVYLWYWHNILKPKTSLEISYYQLKTTPHHHHTKPMCTNESMVATTLWVALFIYNVRWLSNQIVRLDKIQAKLRMYMVASSAPIVVSENLSSRTLNTLPTSHKLYANPYKNPMKYCWSL